MRVVIIGPGRVGCGYLAPLFREGGWETVLAARTAATVRGIRAARYFQVRVAGRIQREVECGRVVVVGSPDFDRAVAEADLVVAAVGVDNVADLGSPLARALASRGAASSPIDVWVTENGECADILASATRAAATASALSLPAVGFAGAVTGVAVAHGGWSGGETPEFVRDDVRWLSVDRTRLTCPLPDLPGVRGTMRYRQRLREKLFVFNAGHALCAYLGALRGHESVAQAIRDPVIRSRVELCLLVSRSALVHAYPGLGHEVQAPVIEALRRFGDEQLADPVARVARNPIRKLGPTGPLVGPAKLVDEAFGRVPTPFAVGVASALLYRDGADAQASTLASMLREAGVASVLSQMCGIDPDDDFGRNVLSRYERLARTGRGRLFERRLERAPVRRLELVGS